MKKSSNSTKTILAVVLFAAMAVIVVFQSARLFQKPAEEPSPPPVAAAQGQAVPGDGATAAPETAKEPAAGQEELAESKPAEDTPESLNVEAQPAAAEATQSKEAGLGKAVEADKPADKPVAQQTSQQPVSGQPEKPAEELPKISFMDEKIDKAFTNSRFFAVNEVLPSGNPFNPPAVSVPIKLAAGLPKQLPGLALPGVTPSSTFTPPSGKAGELPVLPLPGEELGEASRLTLAGISQSGNNATALFSIERGSEKELIMAHPGWVIGNDFVFVGAENGKAKVFNRKTNRVIQLATGETI